MATSTPPAYHTQYISTSISKLDKVWSDSYYVMYRFTNKNHLKIIGEIPSNLENLKESISNELLSLGINKILIETTNEGSLTFSFKLKEFRFYLEAYNYEFEDNVDTICSWYEGNNQLPTLSGTRNQVLHQIKRLSVYSFV